MFKAVNPLMLPGLGSTNQEAKISYKFFHKEEKPTPKSVIWIGESVT
jgi:hypothetical protein